MDFDCGKLRADAQAATERLHAANAEIRSRMDEVEEFVTLHRIGMMGEPYHVRSRIDGGQV